MSELPERINVMKVISYDVNQIANDIHAETEIPHGEITLWDIMQRVEVWVESDFSCGHGHETNTRDLIFHDENGEDLDW
jgi:hypothetical protein